LAGQSVPALLSVCRKENEAVLFMPLYRGLFMNKQNISKS
jgi:hypothetical protein